MSAHPSAPSLARASARRPLYAVVGLVALTGAVALIGPWAFALWLVPDVALIAGFRRGFADDGRLAPRAVPFYNAVHSLPAPVAVSVVGAVAGAPLVAGLGVLWISHVTLDRAMGYGLRTPAGEQRG